jgi:hypothetical protein
MVHFESLVVGSLEHVHCTTVSVIGGDNEASEALAEQLCPEDSC